MTRLALTGAGPAGGGEPEVPAFTFQGTLAYTSGSSQDYSSGVVQLWDSELYDTDGSHSTASNTDRITIPLALNGKYGVFHIQSYISNATTSAVMGFHHILKGGAGYEGFGAVSGYRTSSGNQNFFLNSKTAPVPLTTGDIFTAQIQSSAGTNLAGTYSYFALEVVG